MNGLVDTVGSLSNYSNANIPARGEVHTPQSKFSKPRTDSIDANMIKNIGVDSPKNGSSSNKNDSKNLHKLAIKNNMYKGYQDEQKNQDEDVCEENSGSSSVNKVNYDK